MPPIQQVPTPNRRLNRRLDSWKEIAAFFDRDERTVKRWEKEKALPVHRLPGGSRSRVFAFTEELTRWMHSAKSASEEPTFEPSSADAAIGDSENIGAAPAGSDAENPTANLPDDHIQNEAAGLEQTSQTPGPVPADLTVPAASPKKHWTILALGALLTMVLLGGGFTAYRHHIAAVARTQAPPSASGTRNSARRVDPEAEEFYLKGRYYWNKRTPADLTTAVDYFTQAIVRDPDYSQAYVGLADCYNLLREFATMPSNEAYPRALSAAKKAVELDPSSAEAHASLAFVTFYWKWDPASAEREFRRAIELDPSYATAHHWYATFLMCLGRHAEALREIDRARQLDPASNSIVADKALILFESGQLDAAVALLQQIEASQPGFFSTHKYLSYIYLYKKDYPQFLAEWLAAANLSHDQGELTVVHAAEQGFKSGGERGMFASVLEAQKKLFAAGETSAFFVADTSARLGQNDEALRYLRIAYERHDPVFLAIREDKVFEPLYSNPAFSKLLAETGLPPRS